MSTDKLEALRKLEKKIQFELVKLGLTLEDFQIRLDVNDADSLSLRIFVNPQAVMTLEELETEVEFDKLTRGL